MSPDQRPDFFPHMEAPEVEAPQKSIPGSIGCLTVFLLGLAIIGLAVAHFYSISDYSTDLNVDGTYYFSGKLEKVDKVLLANRYKLVIQAQGGERLILPPITSPIEQNKKVLLSLPQGTCIDGDLTVKGGFLHDLSLRINEKVYHFDTDAGWLNSQESAP